MSGGSGSQTRPVSGQLQAGRFGPGRGPSPIQEDNMANTEIRNYLQNYIDLLKGMKQPEPSEQSNGIYNALMNDLELLSEESGQWFQKDQKNRACRPLNGEGLNTLISAYKLVLDDCDNFLTDTDTSVNQAPKKLTKEIQNLLSKDFVVLNGIDLKTPVTLPEAVGKARTRVVDITGQEISHKGGNLSARIPMTIQGDDGREYSGFFTEEVKTRKKEELKHLFDTYHARYPEMEQVLEAGMGGKGFLQKYYYMGDAEEDQERRRQSAYRPEGRWNDVLAAADVSKERIMQISRDDAFASMMDEFTMAFATLQNKYGIFEDAGIEDNRGLDQRNSAMSTVSAMLGRRDLLALAVPMKIADGDQVKKGTFMANADGFDISHLPDNSPMYQLPADAFESPKAYKDIADMQVIDYICGNVDRHTGNAFYRFDQSDPQHPVFTGLIGIDNDCSFGKLNPEDPKANNIRLVPISNMKVMSESMAFSVCSMQKGALIAALRNYDLTTQEMEAAWERTRNLQEAISKGMNHYASVNLEHDPKRLDQGFIRIVPDADWSKFRLKDMGLKYDRNNPEMNLFNLVGSIPKLLSRERNRIAADQQIAAYEKAEKARKAEEKLPDSEHAKQEPAEQKPAKKAEKTVGKVLNDFDPRVLRQTGEQMEAFSKELSAADPFYLSSSKEFKAMKKSFQELQNVVVGTQKKTDPESLQTMQKAYRELQKQAKAYLDYKGAPQSEHAAARVLIARKLLNFSGEKCEAVRNGILQQEQAAFQKETEAIPEGRMKDLGMRAAAAQQKLMEFSQQESLTPENQQEARQKIATMMVYVHARMGEQLKDYGKLVNQLLENPELAVQQMNASAPFQKITADLKPETLEQFASKKGMVDFDVVYMGEIMNLKNAQVGAQGQKNGPQAKQAAPQASKAAQQAPQQAPNPIQQAPKVPGKSM